MTADSRSTWVFQYATIGRWAEAIPKGFEPEDWLKRPPGNRNHAHWIYGHVAVSSDIAPGLVPVEPLISRELRDLFDQGTSPDPEGKGYPAPQELSATIERTMARNLEIIQNLDFKDLGEPPLITLDESIRGFLKTRERWLGFAPLHLSYHLGQIQLIQRALHPGTEGL